MWHTSNWPYWKVLSTIWSPLERNEAQCQNQSLKILILAKIRNFLATFLLPELRRRVVRKSKQSKNYEFIFFKKGDYWMHNHVKTTRSKWRKWRTNSRHVAFNWFRKLLTQEVAIILAMVIVEKLTWKTHKNFVKQIKESEFLCSISLTAINSSWKTRSR